MPHNKYPALPKVTEATLVGLLGDRAPSQDSLWARVGDLGQGTLAMGIAIRSAQLEAVGLSPRDTGLYMAAWVVAALAQQATRDADLPTLNALLRDAWEQEPTIRDDASLHDGATEQLPHPQLDDR